jgi:hypothetical protein
VALPLAGVSPEDIGGMPRPNDAKNPTAFRYLAPQWFDDNRDKDFVLFLDEFNQASIDTMHAMFYLVNDRMTAGQKNPKMRIVAAGNTEDENEFLTPIPKPLRDRFVYQIKWSGDIDASIKYLTQKYPDPVAQSLLDAVNGAGHSDVTARHIEQCIFMALDGIFDRERGRDLVGAAYDVFVERLSVKDKHAEDDRLKYLSEVKKNLNKKYTVVAGKMQCIDNDQILSSLTEEERELIGA